MVYKKAGFYIVLFFAGTLALFSSGCSEQEKRLTVYAGKGLQAAVEEIVHSFEQSHKVSVNVVYGGSQTLLSVMQTTQKGDVFIPGALRYIEEAGDLVAYYKIIAEHRPAVMVRGDNLKDIVSLQDLTKPGIKLAIGNKKTCALGQATDKLLERTGYRPDFLKNVTIQGSTANELLDLVIQGEVDAAITHSHLLTLPTSHKLRKIDIPASLVESLKIPLGVLRFSENRKVADQFCIFVETEGREFLKKHGLGG
jgi:molybdate transport system substrate-binding protein